MNYNYETHLQSYCSILETWLSVRSPKRLKESIRFYSPTDISNKRYHIVNHLDLSEVDISEKIKVSGDFGNIDWESETDFDALILENAIVKNSNIIVGDNVFSQSPFGEWERDRPMLNLDRKVSLCTFYKFYSYDIHSKTAVINLNTTHNKSISDICFIFDSINGTQNFGHFIHDTMTQIGIYDYVKTLFPDIKPVVIGKFKYPMQQFLFERLVQKNYLSINPNQQFHFKKLVLPRKINRWFGHNDIIVRKAAIEYLKLKIQKLANEVANNSINKDNLRAVYISRKDGNNSRTFSNQDAIENLMNRHAIKEIIVSHLNPENIVKLFNSAELIIGAHGAGLMNYVFSNNPVTLIEIEPSIHGCARSIKDFGELYGVNCLRVKVEKNVENALPLVDMEQLCELVNKYR